MFEQRVSSRYAKALLETAVKEGVSDKLYEDFRFIDMLMDMSDELRSITQSPIVRAWMKKNIYKELLQDKVNKLTLDFIMMLSSKGRDCLIPSIINQYVVQFYKMNRLLPVEIHTTVELDGEMRSKIESFLTQWSKQTVLPKYKINAALKGGILIKFDDWVYDGSVKHQLEILYDRLISGETA